MSNKRQATLTEMLNKTKELIDNGKNIMKKHYY